MSKFRRTLLLLACWLVLSLSAGILSGCGGLDLEQRVKDADKIDTPVEKPVAPPPGKSYSLDYGSMTETPTAGWTGSIFFRDQCSSGSVASGIEGRWAPGNAPSPGIPAIQLICRQLRTDGSLGGVTKTPYRDGSNGGSPFSGNCSLANALVGMHGGNGSTIDHLAGRCAPLGGSSNEVIGPWGGAWLDNFNLACPSGYVVTGIVGSYGQTLGRLSLICTAVKPQ